MAIITRRSILRGLFAAPALVAASRLMPLRGLVMPEITMVTRGINGLIPAREALLLSYMLKLQQLRRESVLLWAEAANSLTP